MTKQRTPNTLSKKDPSQASGLAANEVSFFAVAKHAPKESLFLLFAFYLRRRRSAVFDQSRAIDVVGKVVDGEHGTKTEKAGLKWEKCHCRKSDVSSSDTVMGRTYGNESWADKVSNRCTGGWKWEWRSRRADVVMIEDLVAFVQALHTHAMSRTSTCALVVVLGLSSQSVVTRGVSALWTAVVDRIGLAGVATRARALSVAVLASCGFTTASVANLGTVTVETCKRSRSVDLWQARRRGSRVIKGSRDAR